MSLGLQPVDLLQQLYVDLEQQRYSFVVSTLAAGRERRSWGRAYGGLLKAAGCLGERRSGHWVFVWRRWCIRRSALFHVVLLLEGGQGLLLWCRGAPGRRRGV